MESAFLIKVNEKNYKTNPISPRVLWIFFCTSVLETTGVVNWPNPTSSLPPASVDREALGPLLALDAGPSFGASMMQ